MAVEKSVYNFKLLNNEPVGYFAGFDFPGRNPEPDILKSCQKLMHRENSPQRPIRHPTSVNYIDHCCENGAESVHTRD